MERKPPCYALIGAGVAAVTAAQEEERKRLAELRAMAEEIQAEVRRFSRALRPLYLEDLGFVPALEMLAKWKSIPNLEQEQRWRSACL